MTASDLSTYADRRKTIETIARMLDYAERNAGSLEGDYAKVEVREAFSKESTWIIRAAQAWYETGSSCCVCHRKITGSP